MAKGSCRLDFHPASLTATNSSLVSLSLYRVRKDQRRYVTLAGCGGLRKSASSRRRTRRGAMHRRRSSTRPFRLELTISLSPIVLRSYARDLSACLAWAFSLMDVIVSIYLTGLISHSRFVIQYFLVILNVYIVRGTSEHWHSRLYDCIISFLFVSLHTSLVLRLLLYYIIRGLTLPPWKYMNATIGSELDYLFLTCADFRCEGRKS